VQELEGIIRLKRGDIDGMYILERVHDLRCRAPTLCVSRSHWTE